MATLQLHYFKPNMLQTPNAGIKDSEVDNRLERDILLTFSKDAKLVAGFPFSQQSWAGQTDVTQIQSGCQDSFKMATSEVASLETNFFWIIGTSGVLTLVSGKAECLLAMGENKKRKHFGMTFSFMCVNH